MEKIASEKSKVLIVGGTGNIGKWLVKASLAQGHPTYVLQQHEARDAAKLQAYMELQLKGVALIVASFSDHESLVDAVKAVDVVVCALGCDNHTLLLQLKLIDAIKEAGNVKRFLPAEFGVDPRWLSDRLILPGREDFYDKMVVRKAIEDARVPHTYILSNLYAMFFVAELCQIDHVIISMPPRDHVDIYGDGNVKAIFVDESDIATYTMKTIDDPRTLNKCLHIRPVDNIISQREMVEKWEDLLGYKLGKTFISADEFLESLKEEKDGGLQEIMGHYYHFFYEGYVGEFKNGEGDEEATLLYPQVKYTTIQDYLKRFL